MKRPVPIPLVLLLGVAAALAGFLAGRSTSSADTPAGAPAVPREEVEQVYTCSMHPQIRLDRPGSCPICEMPLIPAASSRAAAGEAPSLQLSEHARAMASVETVPVERRALTSELRAVGRIEFNESALAAITPRVDGYVERLFVSVTGTRIRAGDHLAEVYSPELLVAQQELLIALQAGGGPLVDLAADRLRLLGLTEAQIADLVEHRRTSDTVTLHAPIHGTVIERGTVEKAAFKAGDVLFRIADLATVWVYLEVYEYDLPRVRYGQRVRITAEALPGRTFEGLVTFVQPVVDARSRTVRVPVHIENPDQALKPGMFVTAFIQAALGRDGHAAPTGVEGRFTCPMHPQVLADGPGACPICEMPLEEIPGAAAEEAPAVPAPVTEGPHYRCPMDCEEGKTYAEPGRCPVCNMRLEEIEEAEEEAGAGAERVLAVPVSAVLDSGTRTLVYVERERGLFEPRELTLGPRAGEWYPVLAGLREGERVVARGNFLLDSQFQVSGLPSLFYPGGLHALPAHHEGHDPAAPAMPPAVPPPAHDH